MYRWCIVIVIFPQVASSDDGSMGDGSSRTFETNSLMDRIFRRAPFLCSEHQKVGFSYSESLPLSSCVHSQPLTNISAILT